MTGLRGDLKAQVDWHGALLQPAVDTTASLTRGGPDPRRVGLPFDLELSARYDGAHLDATLRGTRREKQIIEVTARLTSKAADWVRAPAGTPPEWTASAHAKLDRFPLRSLEQLDDRQVRGFVSGELSVDGLHDDARATGTLAFEELQIGDVVCKGSTLRASVDGHAVDATAILDQADGGSIRIQARGGSRWGRAMTPQIDTSQLAQASVSAKKFRATLLLPFVSGSFAELGGRIDGDASVEIDPTRQIARPSGTIAWTEGTFELSAMGTEFHGVSAKLAVTPDGVIRLQDVVAHGTTGNISAYASAWLAGFSVGGASASIQIPSDDPLPLAYHGVPLGKINGRWDITANRTAQELDVVVDVPSAALEIASGSGTRDVQELGDIAGVHIGVQRASDEFVELSLDAAHDEAVDETSSAAKATAAKGPIKIEIRLGGDVRVTRGTDLDVGLEGHPTVTIGPGVHVSGQIRLVRGKINVQGKPFEIERGTVTFVGAEPSNPQVVLTAGWTAADGTRVFADFVGPLKTGKVTLRSEPARPQNEILALLLFGTTDQTTANATQAPTGAAVYAGDVATQPLNQALGGVNRSLDKLGLAGGITTKVDTSTPNPRPEVEVQIARDLSIQIAWVLGVLPPGTNPDTAYLTLNWRLLRNVSLETTVGDAGSSIVDVIWQHRY
jgi:translocation and assembly module TamB